MAEAVERARELIQRYGWNTTCFQLLNPGISLWFSPSQEGVVGYVKAGRFRIVAGAPVCALEQLPSIVQEWEAECDRARRRVCYFGAERRLRELTSSDARYSTVSLGSQPLWSPASLRKGMLGDPSLRAQISRSRNKGVRVREWSAEEANGHPALRAILDQWLETRGLPPMHFLVEPETLGSLQGRRVFVAERDGEPVAFLNLSPIPARKGWLTEQFVRGRKAPNGSVELLMFEAACAVQDDELVTMGIVPLAERGVREAVDNPRWLQAVAAWARAHGRRFYNFEGLEWFKDKFHPDTWEPIYAISKEPAFTFGSLHAIAAAFTGGPPELAIGKGIWKAALEEVSRLRQASH